MRVGVYVSVCEFFSVCVCDSVCVFISVSRSNMVSPRHIIPVRHTGDMLLVVNMSREVFLTMKVRQQFPLKGFRAIHDIFIRQHFSLSFTSPTLPPAGETSHRTRDTPAKQEIATLCISVPPK